VIETIGACETRTLPVERRRIPLQRLRTWEPHDVSSHSRWPLRSRDVSSDPVDTIRCLVTLAAVRRRSIGTAIAAWTTATITMTTVAVTATTVVTT